MKRPPKYVIVQGCPVPRLLAPFVRTLLAETGASLASCYRGDDARALLHRLGKRSQVELYDCWRHGRPGCLPANPPGFSTHELRNDGEAYSQWRRGARIPWWACGLDVDDAHVERVERAAARKGWKVARTYPSSHAEHHHLNFRKPPLRKRLRARARALFPIATDAEIAG